MIRRSLHLRYLFGGSKDHSHTGAPQHHQVDHSHHEHSDSHSVEHDPHGHNKQNYIISGNGPFSNLAKKWLRFTGWEPDVPRSRTQSTHFNQFLNIPITHEKTNSLYRYMQYVPTSLIRFFAANVKETLQRSENVELNSDYYVPKEAEKGSIFVYESIHEGNALKKFRTLELSIFFVPFLSGYPVASYFGLAVGYFFLHPRIYVPSKVLVRRLDIIPETNQLRIERVGFLGTGYIVYMNPQDLKILDQNDKQFDSVSFWSLNRGYVDKELVFRNQSTGDLLVFDKDGLWSEQGLKHSLIH